MFTNTKRRFTVWYQRSINKIHKPGTSGPDIVLYKTAFSIFRFALKDPAAVLLSSPNNDRRMIKLEAKGIYIVLNRYTVEITNHNFSYHLELGPELMNKMLKMFDNKLQLTIDEEEAQFKDQRSLGLLNVLDIMVYGV
jgi:hypothetical protein